ncbi:MAG: hypothetical protein AB1778_03545 [Candidatus Bipolaricaulota bacterium]
MILPAGWSARPARAGDADPIAEPLSARLPALGLTHRATREDIGDGWSSPRARCTDLETCR